MAMLMFLFFRWKNPEYAHVFLSLLVTNSPSCLGHQASSKCSQSGFSHFHLLPPQVETGEAGPQSFPVSSIASGGDSESFTHSLNLP